MFSTKDRRMFLQDKAREELHSYIIGILKNKVAALQALPVFDAGYPGLRSQGSLHPGLVHQGLSAPFGFAHHKLAVMDR